MNRILGFMSCAMLVACSGSGDQPEKPEPETPPANAQADSKPDSKPSDPLAKPDTSFAHALDRLRAIDVEGLQACLIPELRDRVLKTDLEKKKAQYGSVPASDFADKVVERGDYADLFNKGGKKFATLVKKDGKWLSQDVWWLDGDDDNGANK